ncbi:MAG TPA: PfkB family carbohydrate kinase [Oscillospiraceae bacterium]|nr:PfkB family carbohydrate kinase [Oscillospiraceae bacterium]HXK77784.1 PfkB family carbohydrate kinase [Oscillospiraceae bacterium]
MDYVPDKNRIAVALKTVISGEANIRALVGFDGYLDRLVRLKRSQTEELFYATIGEFAEFIRNKQGISSDIAFHTVSEQFGGNGPLMALALAEKGFQTTCIGAMGLPEPDRHFTPLCEKARVVSICEYAPSFNMEFQDGKLMFGEGEKLDGIDWARIKEAVGFEELACMFEGADVFGYANWSSLSKSADILGGILSEILSRMTPRPEGCRRLAFFDLADPSAKAEEQFQELFDAIRGLRKRYTVAVGLNRKEFLAVYNQWFGKTEKEFSERLVEELCADFPADEVAVHVPDGSYAVEIGKGYGFVPVERVEAPVLTTGAGDNYNSGYCLGAALNLPAADCALLGNLSGRFLVKTGRPASSEELLHAVTTK